MHRQAVRFVLAVAFFGATAAGLLNWAPAFAQQEAAAVGAKDVAAVGAGKDGFFIKSADGNFILKLRGLIQVDGGFYHGDELKPSTDTFQISRARPIVEATVFKIYDVRITPDFGLGKTVLQDAYFDARFSPAAKLRAGKFKTPFGLERLQSASDLVFVARALTNNLVPNRDIGIQVHGDIRDGVVSYAAGVFNGVPDGSSADADINDSKDEAARVFFQPFKKTSVYALQGLGFGVAATDGVNRGTPAATGLAPYKTAGQMNFFTYLAPAGPTAANTVVADGRRSRLSPQLTYYVGRFGLLADYVRSSQEVRIGTSEAELTNTSWQATASFFLTPDKAAYKLVAPKKPLDAAGHGAGGWEIAGRYGRLSIDGDAFPVFADPAASPQQATEKAVGLNWYLNRNIRMLFDYSLTTFKGGAAAGGDREDERVVLSRLQFAF